MKAIDIPTGLKLHAVSQPFQQACGFCPDCPSSLRIVINTVNHEKCEIRRPVMALRAKPEVEIRVSRLHLYLHQG